MSLDLWKVKTIWTRLSRAEEEKRGMVLENQVLNWHKSQQIRQFIGAVREGVKIELGSDL